MSKKFVGVLSTASNAPFGVFNEGDCRELVIIRHSWHTTSSTEAHHRRRNTELSTGVLMDLQGRDSMDLRGIHQRLTQLTTLIGSMFWRLIFGNWKIRAFTGTYNGADPESP